MENLKIKVDSDKESKEIQELFFKLGADWKYRNIGKKYHHDDKIGFLYCDGESITTGEKDYGLDYFKNRSPHHKEITIDQLRDMVVLKRNSAEDANYTCDRGKKYYATGNDVYMYIHQGVWSLCENFPLEKAIENWKLKPIKKEKIMKEYLDPDNEYALILADDDTKSDQWIEVPEGAEILVYWNGELKSYFYKENSLIFKNGFWGEVGKGYKMEHIIGGVVGKILWKREKPQEKCADVCVEAGGNDVVSHPQHYCSHPSGIECIEITRHHDFAIGNAIKYLWRAGLKDSDNEVQDLKKAVWYIQDKIKQLESKVVDDKTLDWIENLEQNT